MSVCLFVCLSACLIGYLVVSFFFWFVFLSVLIINRNCWFKLFKWLCEAEWSERAPGHVYQQLQASSQAGHIELFVTYWVNQKWANTFSIKTSNKIKVYKQILNMKTNLRQVVLNKQNYRNVTLLIFLYKCFPDLLQYLKICYIFNGPTNRTLSMWCTQTFISWVFFLARSQKLLPHNGYCLMRHLDWKGLMYSQILDIARKSLSSNPFRGKTDPDPDPT